MKKQIEKTRALVGIIGEKKRENIQAPKSSNRGGSEKIKVHGSYSEGIRDQGSDSYNGG